MTTIGRRRYSGAFPKTCQSDFGLTGFLSFLLEIPFAVLDTRSLTQYYERRWQGRLAAVYTLCPLQDSFMAKIVRLVRYSICGTKQTQIPTRQQENDAILRTKLQHKDKQCRGDSVSRPLSG